MNHRKEFFGVSIDEVVEVVQRSELLLRDTIGTAEVVDRDRAARGSSRYARARGSLVVAAENQERLLRARAGGEAMFGLYGGMPVKEFEFETELRLPADGRGKK